jgi:hypothetical protein
MSIMLCKMVRAFTNERFEGLGTVSMEKLVSA